MSINVKWLAVEGGRPLDLMEQFGLMEVGASHAPDEAAYAYAITPKGWLVLVSRSMKPDFTRLLPVLSAETQVLAGETSEVVMVSTLQGWSGGAQLWTVSHDPEKGLENLDVQGEPLSALAGIATKLAADQAADTEDVDHLFDAPLELGEQLCGYRPDAIQSGLWILLAPEPKRSLEPRASALPAAIRAELIPAMAELGWTVGPVRLSTGTYDATLLREGRLEAIRFLWGDDRRKLVVFPGFAHAEGGTADGRVIAAASIPPRPESLAQRLRAWRFGRPPKTYDQKVRDAIAEARARLAEYDKIIASEPPDEMQIKLSAIKASIAGETR